MTEDNGTVRGDLRRRDVMAAGGAAVLAAAAGGAARAQGAPALTPLDIAGYRPTDDFFGKPFIEKDQWLEAPSAHRYVYGGFEGTDTRFGFYFPPAAAWQGRFTQMLSGGLGGADPGPAPQLALNGFDHFSYAVRLGAYLVASNQGHFGSAQCKKGKDDASVYGYRASAESARFGRHLARQVYGKVPHHGYVYGGSGGARRSVNCVENVDDVWDGTLVFMGGGSSVPLAEYDRRKPAEMTGQGFSAMFNVQRTLGPKLLKVIDNLDPGGSGNPFDGLEAHEREALADLYRLGYPRGDELMIAYPVGQIGLWSWSAESLKAQDPEYWTDFWTKPGYGGKDQPHLFAADLVDTEVTVRKVVTAGEMARRVAAGGPEAGSAMAARAAIMPPDYPIAIDIGAPQGYVLGSSLKILSGAAAGRQLWCVNRAGDLLMSDGIGEAGNLKFQGVAAGDRIKMDNRDFLAYCHFYKHHTASVRMPGLARFRVDGRSVYPQRPPMAMDPLMGPQFTGVFKKPMLWAQHTHDASLWPGSVIDYASVVAGAQGKASAQRFRLRWVENGEHGGAPRLPVRPAVNTRLLDMDGVSGHIEQNLHDLVAWVERGTVPAVDSYTIADDLALKLPATAAARGGIQPVLTAKADGGVRADVRRGQAVTFQVEAEVPKGAGRIIDVKWDFDGEGKYPYHDPSIDGTKTKVLLTTSHAFDTPGTYFPAVVVISHRDGDRKAPGRRVANLARVRVVVT